MQSLNRIQYCIGKWRVHYPTARQKLSDKSWQNQTLWRDERKIQQISPKVETDYHCSLTTRCVTIIHIECKLRHARAEFSSIYSIIRCCPTIVDAKPMLLVSISCWRMDSTTPCHCADGAACTLWGKPCLNWPRVDCFTVARNRKPIMPTPFWLPIRRYRYAKSRVHFLGLRAIDGGVINVLNLTRTHNRIWRHAWLLYEAGIKENQAYLGCPQTGSIASCHKKFPILALYEIDSISCQ